MWATAERQVARLFAEILDYPRPGLLEAVRECEAFVAARYPEAEALLGGFRAYVEKTPLGELEEVYTGAFDLDTLSDFDATCYPYVGHHLFGESYKRSTFLLELNERFRAHGFSAGTELPDHLVVLLRFLTLCEDPALVDEVVRDALLPALERMVGDEGNGGSESKRGAGRQAYLTVLRALRFVLEPRPGAEVEPVGRS